MNTSLIWVENRWVVKPDNKWSEQAMNLINTFGNTLPIPKFNIGKEIYFHKNSIDMNGVIEKIHLGVQVNDYEEQTFVVEDIYYVVMANSHVRWVTDNQILGEIK